MALTSGLRSQEFSKEFPHMVSILYSSKHLCSGSLLTEKAVITTAHCCNHISDDLNLAKVSAGSDIPNVENSYISDLSKSYWTSKGWKNHNSSLSSWTQHELCVLILDDSLPTSNSKDVIAPIAYEQDLSLPRMGDKCQVSGWKNANSKLIHWNVTIVDDSLCGDAFEKYNATENLGCAQGEEGVGQCFGDENTPIICNGKLSGVLIQCDNRLAAFTRLAPHKEFIAERIKDNVGDNAKKNHLAALLISSLIPVALSLLVN